MTGYGQNTRIIKAKLQMSDRNILLLAQGVKKLKDDLIELRGRGSTNDLSSVITHPIHWAFSEAIDSEVSALNSRIESISDGLNQWGESNMVTQVP
jgi:hypothetical protein